MHSVRILAWTLLWAVSATFTTFIGGILLAKLINHEDTHFKKMWRSLFVVTIAIPQFVTLLLLRNMFSDHRNCQIHSAARTSVWFRIGYRDLGLDPSKLYSVSALNRAGRQCNDRSHQYLGRCSISDADSATGVLMNIPDRVSRRVRRIDGANSMPDLPADHTCRMCCLSAGPSLVYTALRQTSITLT